LNRKKPRSEKSGVNTAVIGSELSEKHFRAICDIVYSACGICLKDGKKALVRARLVKRLRALRLGSFEEYIDYLGGEQGTVELPHMIDAMTTNKTGFFRENDHFDYLAVQVLPKLDRRRLRFWTAACSSGEEPYSLAITLFENLPDIDARDVKILATDISYRMLEKGKAGVYGADSVASVDRMLLSRYFDVARREHPSQYRIKDRIRAMVHMGYLNLLEPWPMRGPFDVIFCRNVMIYFDKTVQQRLIDRFWDLISPGGYLFVGHSEGLSAVKHRFRYVKPAVYVKN
jgi:chemotaxis protein methyltransferase CheR